MSRGVSRQHARRAAARYFGGISQIKEIHREMLSFTWPYQVPQT